MKKILPYAGILLLVGGCAVVNGSLRKPTLRFEKMKIEDASLFGGTLVFPIRMINPNDAGLPVRRLLYHLRFEGQSVKRETLSPEESVPPRGALPLEITVPLDFLDRFGTAHELFGHRHASYELMGSVGAGPFEIPFHIRGRLEIPQIPEVTLDSLFVSSLSITRADVVYVLGLRNPNAFPIEVSSLRHILLLEGMTFSEGSSLGLPAVPPTKKAAVEIPGELEFMRLGLSAYTLLTRSKARYQLLGELVVQAPGLGEVRLPFQSKGVAVIQRDGSTVTPSPR